MKVTVNGKTIEVEGSNVSIINGTIIVDGVKLNLDNLDSNCTVKIEGNISGGLICDKSVIVNGNIDGDVKAKGSINCNNITGNVEASGSINCDDVDGKVKAGGSINCDNITTK